MGWVILAVAVMAGCGPKGPPIAVVSGTVTFRGEPVSIGEVIFISDDGHGSSGKLQEDGTFMLVSQHGKGIPLGQYLVAITPPDPDDLPDRGLGLNFDNIPDRYQHFGSSGFVVTVESGSNSFAFAME